MKKIGNYLFPSSDTHFERWMLYGEYQAKQRNALFNYMEEKRNIEYIVDFGCHVGLLSRPMIQRANTRYIWAFEPNSSVRECYVMNMSRFDNYTIYPIALGDKNTKGYLNVEKDNSGNTNIDPIKSGDTEIKTLDSFNLKQIDYMKVDAEGYEYNIVQGAKETIERCKPFVHLEMKTKRMRHTNKDYTKLLNTMNYKEVFRIGAEVLYDYNS